MDVHEAKESSETSFSLRARIQGALIIAAVVLVGLAAAGMYRMFLARRVAADLAAIEAAGLPVMPGDLDAWYHPPAGANAAECVQRGYALLHTGSRETLWLTRFISGGWPQVGELREQIHDLFGQIVRGNQAALEQFHEAAAIGRARYPVDLSDVTRRSTRHLRQVLTGVSLLVIEAIHAADQQDPDAAVAACRAAFRLAGTLSAEPTVTAQQVRLLCVRRAVESLEWLVNHVSLSEDHRRTMMKTLQGAVAPEAVTRAYAGERCIGPWFYALPAAEQRQVLNFDRKMPFAHYLYRPLGLMDMDLHYFLSIMDRLIALTRAPAPERIKRFDALTGELRAIPDYLLGSVVYFPNMPQVIVQDTDVMGLLRAAQAALAVESYRSLQGKLPPDLDALVPDFLDAAPEDPFLGYPLRYRSSDSGYIVYSVGANRMDDGGVIRKDDLTELVFFAQRRGAITVPDVMFTFPLDTCFRVTP